MVCCREISRNFYRERLHLLKIRRCKESWEGGRKRRKSGIVVGGSSCPRDPAHSRLRYTKDPHTVKA